MAYWSFSWWYRKPVCLVVLCYFNSPLLDSRYRNSLITGIGVWTLQSGTIVVFREVGITWKLKLAWRMYFYVEKEKELWNSTFVGKKRRPFWLLFGYLTNSKLWRVQDMSFWHIRQVVLACCFLVFRTPPYVRFRDVGQQDLVLFSVILNQAAGGFGWKTFNLFCSGHWFILKKV